MIPNILAIVNSDRAEEVEVEVVVEVNVDVDTEVEAAVEFKEVLPGVCPIVLYPLLDRPG